MTLREHIRQQVKDIMVEELGVELQPWQEEHLDWILDRVEAGACSSCWHPLTEHTPLGQKLPWRHCRHDGCMCAVTEPSATQDTVVVSSPSATVQMAALVELPGPPYCGHNSTEGHSCALGVGHGGNMHVAAPRSDGQAWMWPVEGTDADEVLHGAMVLGSVTPGEWGVEPCL